VIKQSIRARLRRPLAPVVVPLDVVWAVALVVVLVVAAAYRLGIDAGVVDGYWQCAGELGVVG
jgi:hypothetical protein